MASKIVLTIKAKLVGDILISEDGSKYKIYYHSFYPKSGYYKLKKINERMYYVLKYV